MIAPFLLLLSAGRAAAGPAAPATPDGGSAWIETAPPKPAAGGGLLNHEQTTQGEQLQRGVFQRLAESVPLEVGQSLNGGQYVSVQGKIRRSLRRYADGSLALVDELPLTLDLQAAPSFTLGPAQLQFWSGGRFEGRSIVVRPARSGSLAELKQELDLLTYKSVLPITAKRLAAMEDGELWKIPLTLTVPLLPVPVSGASVAIPAGHFTLVLGASRDEERDTTVTLYRMSRGQLRLRLRFDRAVVLDVNGGVYGTYGVADIGLESLSSAVPVLGHTLAAQLDHYLQGDLDVDDNWRGSGERSFLEFMLDPNDEAQMDELRRLLLGDINMLGRLIKEGRGGRRPSVADSPEEALQALSAESERALGLAPSSAGVDDYARRAFRPHLRLPLLLNWDSTRSSEEHKIVDGAAPSSVAAVSEADRRRVTSLVELPALGYLVRKDVWSGVQVYVDDVKGKADLTLLYTDNRAYQRLPASTPEDIASQLNDVARLAGTRGEGSNPATALPLSRLFPPGARDLRPGSRRGTSSFALILDQRAIDDVLAAPPALVAKAFVHSLDGQEQSFAVSVLGRAPRLDGNRPVWSPSAVAAQAGGRGAGTQQVGRAERLAGSLQGLLSDLDAARNAPGQQRRAAALRRVLDGSGRSGLAYTDALKVIVQLARPADMSGLFQMDADAGGRKVAAYCVFNPDLPEAKRLAQLKAKKDRYEPPSPLTD